MGFYPDTPYNGRIGSQYIFSAQPIGKDQCCATTQWATAMVWEQENIGLVMTVSAYEVEGKNVEFSILGENSLDFLIYLSFLADELVNEAFGS